MSFAWNSTIGNVENVTMWNILDFLTPEILFNSLTIERILHTLHTMQQQCSHYITRNCITSDGKILLRDLKILETRLGSYLESHPLLFILRFFGIYYCFFFAYKTDKHIQNQILLKLLLDSKLPVNISIIQTVASILHTSTYTEI